MDAVYLFRKNHTNNSEELRYSLRSLKNLPHNRVVIVGEKPDWVQNIYFIPVKQNLTKGENVRNNLITACKDSTISDDFILMNDDFFIMKELNSLFVYNRGKIKDLIEEFQVRFPAAKDIEGYQTTERKLKEMTVCANPPISYELHVPMQINKEKFLIMLKDIGDEMYRLQRRTLYGNYYNLGGETIKDVKIFSEIKRNPKAYNLNPQNFLCSQTFLSCSNDAFAAGLAGKRIRKQFSSRSFYEK